MATASWKSKFQYNSKAYIEHEVNGNVLRFYPNRISLLEDLAAISKPIAHALGTLFSEGRSDTTSTSETYKDKPKKDLKAGTETCESIVDKIIVEAVSPEIADHRRNERNGAITELIEGVTNKRTQLQVGRLLMDSLRDEFEYKKDRPVAEVEEFLFGNGDDDYNGLNLPVLSQLIIGWLKANAKVFGNMGEKVTNLVQGKLEALRSPSPSEETTRAVDGSSSKTPSSPELDTASASTGSNS